MVASNGAVEPQGRAPNRRPQRRAATQPRIDYSRFSHQTHVTTQKLACDSCHKFPTKNWKEVRQGDAAFPDVTDFPEHSSCLNCHRQQFFARERPAPVICSNCHVNVTPRDTTRFLFPSLGDVSDPSKQRRDVVTDFAINFPHDKHVDVVGLNVPALSPPNRVGFVSVSWQQKPAPKDATEPKSCPVCHQTYQPQGKSDEEYVTTPPKKLGDNFWLKKGTFKTAPSSHTVCFTCHNADLGIEPAPSACDVCHKFSAIQPAPKTDFDPKLAETIGVTDKTVLTAWHRRISSATFRHEGGEHPNISCVTCHNVPTMNTLDMKTLVVPVRSCGGAEGCHVTATTDDGGILNYEIDHKKTDSDFVCTKCHITLGKSAVPATHVKAIDALKKP
ncbi:MAG: cytochrome c3 family protein [Acidobacteriota bacterium]